MPLESCKTKSCYRVCKERLEQFIDEYVEPDEDIPDLSPLCFNPPPPPKEVIEYVRDVIEPRAKAWLQRNSGGVR